MNVSLYWFLFLFVWPSIFHLTIDFCSFISEIKGLIDTFSNSDYEIFSFTCLNHLVLFKSFRHSSKMIQTSAILLSVSFPDSLSFPSLKVLASPWASTDKGKPLPQLCFGCLSHVCHLSLSDVAGPWCCRISVISAAWLALSQSGSLSPQGKYVQRLQSCSSLTNQDNAL